jgi:O-antigen/teichoic acid export membrane protein
LLGWTTRATITSTALVASAVLLLSPFRAPLLDVPVSLPIAGAGMALCMAAWMLAKAACQAREDWPRFVAVELVWGIVLLTGPALLAWRAMFDWRWGVGMFSLAYAVGALAAARYMRTALRGSSLSVSAPLGPFGRYALLSGVTTAIFVFGDRFVVQRTFGLNEVGIYQVYSSATIGLASVLGMVVNNFVFPLFSRGDRASFTQLFRRFAVRAIPIAFVVLFVCGAAQVLLASFPLHPVLLAIASLSASLSLLASPLGVLLLSQGVSGSRRAAAVNVLSLTVFVVGVFPAIRFGGLIGVFAIQAVLYSLTFVLYRSALLSLPDPRAPTRV